MTTSVTTGALVQDCDSPMPLPGRWHTRRASMTPNPEQGGSGSAGAWLTLLAGEDLVRLPLKDGKDAKAVGSPEHPGGEVLQDLGVQGAG